MHLFGDSILLDLPNGDEYCDASEFRQVPDNQEVFVSMKDPNDAIIVEILESPTDEASLNAGVLYYFDNLVEENEATQWSPLTRDDCQTVHLTWTDPKDPLNRPQAEHLSGWQRASKFSSKEPATTINLDLGLIRLPGRQADILISIYRSNKDADNISIKSILESFKLLKWNLFE